MRWRDIGTDRCSWRDVKALVTNLPRDSALVFAEYPDESLWGMPEHLLARAVEALEWLQWAKTEDARRKRNRPKPIYRPGVEKPEEEKSIGAAIPLDEMESWLGWKKGGDT